MGGESEKMAKVQCIGSSCGSTTADLPVLHHLDCLLLIQAQTLHLWRVYKGFVINLCTLVNSYSSLHVMAIKYHAMIHECTCHECIQIHGALLELQ